MYMNKKLLLIILSVVLTMGIKAQRTAQEVFPDLGMGINIGNTFDAPDGEGTWNKNLLQEYYFDDIKAAGFKTVRLPVTWYKHTGASSPYTINEVWMKRIEQVVDWGLARGLNIILNAHHEEPIKAKPLDATVKASFDSTWAQISRRFQSKSDKLFFEILIEPHDDTKPVTQSIIYDLNKRILAIIRKTNPTRIVVFSGIEYCAFGDLTATVSPDLNDPYLMGYYHSYDPWNFAGLATGTYGSATDLSDTHNKFAAVEAWSKAHNNTPVLLDEFGAVISCDYNSRMLYLATIAEETLNHNVSGAYWDEGGTFQLYDRVARTWSEGKDVLIYTTKESPTKFVAKLAPLDTVVKLSWVNRTTLNDSICVARRKGNGQFVVIAKLSPLANAYNDSITQGGYNYYYRVETSLNKTTILQSYPQMVQRISTVRTPYLGTAVSLPGVIEAENYDLGGEGLAFHDFESANLGKGMRLDEGVDIEKRTDGGFNLGYVEIGEWVEYSVSVTDSNTYKIEAEVACMEAGGIFNFSFKKSNGTPTTVTSGDVTTIATSSWETTKKVYTIVTLKPGNYIMRFNVKAKPAFNVNRFNITKFFTSLPPEEKGGAILDAKFQVSPNPAHSEIKISGLDERFNASTKILIYNALGALQFEYNRSLGEESVNLDISSLKPGVYIVKIGNSDEKIVVQ